MRVIWSFVFNTVCNVGIVLPDHYHCINCRYSSTPVYVICIYIYIGIVVSLYYLITNYLKDDPSAADDPISHICTDALLCILFRFGPNKEHTGRKLYIFLYIYLIFLYQLLYLII